MDNKTTLFLLIALALMFVAGKQHGIQYANDIRAISDQCENSEWQDVDPFGESDSRWRDSWTEIDPTFFD